jgi:hypothetical protein
MTRFNLWITDEHGSKVICHGSQGEMNDLALSPALTGLAALGAVHVLPDHEEPSHCLSPALGRLQPCSAPEGEPRP